MKVIFWDIDGTLIKTGKAGLYAFSQATDEILGKQPDFSTIHTAGSTDSYIAAEIILNATGLTASEKQITALVRRYEELLPEYLAKCQGHTISPVVDILTYLKDQPDMMSLLLTGNTIFGAKSKLKQYNLAHFFDFSTSAFGDIFQKRSDIAAYALSCIHKRFPELIVDDIFIIGDTPNDIHCGKSIGARTIAVATGMYSLNELVTHSPWWGVTCLPAPEEFVHKLSTSS